MFLTLILSGYLFFSLKPLVFEPLGHSSLNTTNFIRHEPALLYDSVYAFAHGVHALLRASETFSPNNISCDQEIAWSEGSSTFNYINSVSYFFFILLIFDNKVYLNKTDLLLTKFIFFTR